MSHGGAFAAVPTAMICDKSVSLYAVMVYAAIASFGGYEIIAPSRETLAARARCSVRKVAEALNELEELGVLERERRTGPYGQATTCYVLVTGRRKRVEAPDALTDEVEAPDALTDEVEAPDALGGGTSEQVTPYIQVDKEQVDNPLTPTGESERSNAVEVSDPVHPDRAFAAFWSCYPRKVGKPVAQKAFERAVKRAGNPTPVLEGARRLRDDPNLPTGADRKFIPHPSTWLNRDGWEDEPLPARGRSTDALEMGRRVDEMLRAEAEAFDWSAGEIEDGHGRA